MFLQLALLALGAGEELPSLLRLTISASSYEFTLKESGPGPQVQGRYQKGSPIAFQSEGIEFFKLGDKLVYKQGERWETSRTGTLSDPLRILGPAARVRSAKLPHEDLAQLDRVWLEPKKMMEKGETFLVGKLNEKGAMLLSRTETQSVARSGLARVWLDTRGLATKYEIEIRLLGRIGGAEVDGTATRTVSLRNVGETRITVPEAASRLLREK